MTGQDRETIMVVDDNKHLLVTLEDYLTFQGYAVVTAATAEDALRTLDRAKPDLIVLDISMPGMGGMGFLKRISAGGGKLSHAVLVLTARAAMEDFFENMEVEGFLAKPCSEAELARKIREILARKAAQVRAAGRGGNRVLLVEHERMTLGGVREALQDAGYEVESAESAQEVLEKATTRRPDLVLMRETLPGMNGSLIASLLGAMPTTRSIPVILYEMPGKLVATERKQSSPVVKVVETVNPQELVESLEDLRTQRVGNPSIVAADE